MFRLLTAAAVVATMSTPAVSQGSGISMGGSMKGSASTFAGSAGASIGNGSSMSEAGQFAGSTGSLKGSASLKQNSGSMQMTVTNESFSSGFDKARSSGSSFAAGVRGGIAESSGSYWGNGGADWGTGSWGNSPQ